MKRLKIKDNLSATDLLVPLLCHLHQILVQLLGKQHIVPLDDIAAADLMLDVGPVG